MPYDITEDRRDEYRRCSSESARAKAKALNGEGPAPLHPINVPLLDPDQLMPARAPNGMHSLSLFSGGGGFDLGFELAGFSHVASFDILEICGETLISNRPKWEVNAGADRGDVRKVDWKRYAGRVDVIHGGPPCQPFSVAGKQLGHLDDRDMWPEFVRAVRQLRPRAFVAENVVGLLDPKFKLYVHQTILQPLHEYKITSFKLSAAMFGVPQARQRVFFVGFASRRAFEHFTIPGATHYFDHLGGEQVSDGTSPMFEEIRDLRRCVGVREALGLEDIGFDALAPTLRSGFTGPRNSTSILNSVASQRAWELLQIWPNGVGASRAKASLFVAQNRHFRLSVQDCALMQGFPDRWHFRGSVYKVLGQIGNSVSPPMAYQVAYSVATALAFD